MHFCVSLEPLSRFFPRICWENIGFSLKRTSLLRHFIISSASNWIGFHLDNIFMRVKETKGRIFNKTGLRTAWDAEQSDRFISSDCEYIWLSLMRHYLYSGYPGSLSSGRGKLNYRNNCCFIARSNLPVISVKRK